MIPVEQTCPKCRNRFVGSDVVGFPCPDCFDYKFDMTLLTTSLNQMYYQEDENDGRPTTN